MSLVPIFTANEESLLVARQISYEVLPITGLQFTRNRPSLLLSTITPVGRIGIGTTPSITSTGMISLSVEPFPKTPRLLFPAAQREPFVSI